MASMLEKLKDAEPYNIFFSSHPDIEETHNHKNFIGFSDLLCPSLGNLKYVLHMTNTVDMEWLLEEYDKAGFRNIHKTVIYGKEAFGIMEFLEDNQFPNLLVHKAVLRDPYGLHHVKMVILVYDDNSLRVAVATANADDVSWHQYGQIMWISPLCKVTAKSAHSGEGPTRFKESLLQYLNNYPQRVVGQCITYIKRADFSDVKVFLVSSVPGTYYRNNPQSQCHLERIAELLSNYCNIPDEFPNNWPIIIQSSSMGNFGYQDEWFRSSLLRSIDSHDHNQKPTCSTANVKIVYPTEQNVLNSLTAQYDPERRVNYFMKDHVWPNKMLCSWKAEKYHLTKVMPRTKTYCRMSPCCKKLAWFLLTSANTSKSAWGTTSRYPQIYCRSFELGVLFIPKYFGEEYFKTDVESGETLFPLMYDTPLTPYKNEDKPWAVNRKD